MKRAAVAVALAVVLAHGAARADGNDPEQLFTAAVQLMEQERFAEAIPKLEEAERLDPGIGTEFNLAVCYEKTGRTGTAYRRFAEVVKLAHASGKKAREEAARDEMTKLEPRLPVLAIDGATAAMAIEIDGAAVAGTDLARFPVDPGDHDVTASAPQKKPWATRVAAPPPGETLHVAVPELADATETRFVVQPEDRGSGRRTLGWVLGGVGVASLAVAGVTGVLLLDAHSTADANCTTPGPDGKKQCHNADGTVNQPGVDAINRGNTLLPINTVAWIVGAVGVGAGAVLILTAPKPPRVSVAPILAPGTAGLAFAGAL
jgi:hypothetical protein